MPIMLLFFVMKKINIVTKQQFALLWNDLFGFSNPADSRTIKLSGAVLKEVDKILQIVPTNL
jgi:hypothetical protein